MTLLAIALGTFVLAALTALGLGRSVRVGSALGSLGAVVGCTLGTLHTARSLITGDIQAVSFPWAIPNGALSIGVDPLSEFFLLPLFVVGGATAAYGHPYLRQMAPRRSLGVPWAAFNLLLASMTVVVVARHVILFLVAWEVMSLAAYVLVTFEHERSAVRRAGWVYLVATHLSLPFLVGCFLLLGRSAGSLDFGVMLAARPDPLVSNLLFALALVGFGAKAGWVPLHVWLPEAHAAAPSHVSALMSGVLIKMGIYGMLRVVVLLGGPRPFWGALLVVLGLCGGVLGIALALYQRNIKRVLAYSSIENMGLVTLGIGVGMWGATSGRPLIATLGLVGGLLHVWNHAVLKGLLFLGAGSVVHGCHDQNIEALGGLCKRMPQTATMLLIGATAIAGLPPLNGFVSEWLLYSSLLRGAIDAGGAAGVAMLVVVALVSLIGAMAALCFARLTGIALLGQPRTPNAASAHESPSGMTLPMKALALLVFVLAVAPALSMGPLDAVVTQLVGKRAQHVPAADIDLSLLTTLNAALAILLVFGVLLSLRTRRGHPPKSDTTWACGYAAPTARMQYTAHSVSELFTTTLLPASLGPRLAQQAPRGPFPARSHLESDTTDPLTRGAYEPFFARWADRFARLRWMQQGLLHVYIVYIVVTLLVALAWSAAAQFSWAR